MSDIQRYEMKRTLGIHPAIKHECGGWVRTNEAFKVIDKQEKTIAEQDKEIESLKAEVERLKRGVNCVFELIDESDGVSGLHQNGEVAYWDSLLSGGQFEEWLTPLSEAVE